jgi:Flp pilus assembly pilin Flp
VRRLLASRDGVTAIEYGILVALMTLVIISSVSFMGSQAFTQLFEKIASSL